jgi:hypothetical protein
MHRLSPVRVLAVALAAASLMAIPLAGPASAVTGTACSAAKFAINTTKLTATGTITGCSNPAATGGKGTATFNFKVVTAIAVKVTWNKTGTSTLKISEKAGSKAQTAKCATAVGKGGSSIVATGSVTGGTGAALKGIPKGSKFSGTFCLSAKTVLSVYPGTKIAL